MSEKNPSDERSIIPYSESGKTPPRSLRTLIAGKIQSLLGKNQSLTPTVGEPKPSNIHPDIEKGLENVLTKHAADASSRGLEGIITLGNRFKKGSDMAGIEFTQDQQQLIIDQVGNTIDQNLSKTLTSSLELEIALLNLHVDKDSTEYKIKGFKEIFAIARARGVSTEYFPSELVAIEGSELAKPLITEEEVIAYYQDQVDKSLLRGIRLNINLIVSEVSQGRLNRVDRIDKEIDELTTYMRERGFEVVDEPVLSGDKVDSLAIVSRVVNKAEISKLREDAVKDNLLKGVKRIIDQVGQNVSWGLDNPFRNSDPDALLPYIQYGKQFDLVTHEGDNLIHEGKFNPDRIQEEIDKEVRENLPTSFNNIIKRSADWIKEGKFGLLDYTKGVLEQYIDLAEKYRVVVNADEIRKKFDSQMTAENIKAGIDATINDIKAYVRNGDFHIANLQADSSYENLKKIISKNNLTDKVDISSLSNYLREINVTHPELPDKTSQ